MLRYALTAVVLLASALAYAKTASEVYEQAAKSTVIVRNIGSGGKAQGMGSGVIFIGGNVVTNCHVVKGASELKVRVGGKDYPATLRFSDWDRDVCSLSVAGINAPAAVVGSTKSLKVGVKVYAIGAPKGLDLTLSDGIVSSLREVEGGRYIQTTAAISPGSSGGGLFDESGALVGLTTFYVTEGQNLNFAVPVEWLKELPKRSAKTATAAQSVTQWLSKAIELESSKDWPALLEHGHRWTKAQPGSDVAWQILGRAYSEVGESAKAIDAYQQALRIDPKNSYSWTGLAIAYGEAGQPTKEIDAYQQALRIDPERASAWTGLAIAYGETGQPAKAIDAYQQALRINPKNSYSWTGLGIAYREAGQSVNAINAIQQALRIDPERATTWLVLGGAYGKFGQPAKAVDAIQQALRIDPKDAIAWAGLGDTYGKFGQPAKAVDAYQQALRINPDYSYAWRSLAIAYEKIGQPAKAIDADHQAERSERKMPWSK